MNNIIQKLLNSPEPSVRFKILVNVLEKNPNSTEIKMLQREIASSPLVSLLLSERDRDGKIPYHPYTKWYGAHWVLSLLADLGYPPKEASLIPLRDQVYEWLLSSDHIESVPIINGRARRCGSQEGNALWSILRLGLDDEGCDRLAENLIRWQWQDGGWNCDSKPNANHSSFHETILPFRALSLYSKLRKSEEAQQAANRAAEMFLKRKLFRRLSDNQIIDNRFLPLHYPCYWHYDILTGLKVMAEAGYIHDLRCREALDILESKRLPDGGLPAEEKYYHHQDKKSASGRQISGFSIVDLGGISKTRMNEFVTADALFVLSATDNTDNHR